ncbi:MAG: hypothetical protein ACRDI2_16130, partial [Chloroflexota bacterium]
MPAPVAAQPPHEHPEELVQRAEAGAPTPARRAGEHCQLVPQQHVLQHEVTLRAAGGSQHHEGHQNEVKHPPSITSGAPSRHARGIAVPQRHVLRVAAPLLEGDRQRGVLGDAAEATAEGLAQLLVGGEQVDGREPADVPLALRTPRPLVVDPVDGLVLG